MKDYKTYLDTIGEIGVVEEIIHAIIHVKGLPGTQTHEIIVFEDGQVGYALSLAENFVEVLLLSQDGIKVGSAATRTNEFLEVEVGDFLLGKNIDPLGASNDGPVNPTNAASEKRRIDISPPGILEREVINEALETGITLVDLTIPLGKGQRELVIGDRKTGKTAFLESLVVHQARRGTVCIYATMGRRAQEVKRFEQYLRNKKVIDNVVIVSTTSPEAAGLIFITPYTAMTIAEYFRDKGKDVLVIFDDLTSHAKYYREISLLARRFPGRSSYPGDIFYIHARLLERGGKFKKGSITCLPIAESVLGDLSGYIQTNLMAMTDGHIFFDSDFYNQGRRPAINPFLSVTRVGRQAQTDLVRDLSREISSFMVYYRKMQEFIHFGAELNEQVRQTLAMGDRLVAFFDQPSGGGMGINISIILTGFLWANFWRDEEIPTMKAQVIKFYDYYHANADYAKKTDQIIAQSPDFQTLVNTVKTQKEFFMEFLFAKGAKENG
ncbi:MAG: F0F1 ATP synthase subunit alpha [Patescibacteria group bacterium]